MSEQSRLENNLNTLTAGDGDANLPRMSSTVEPKLVLEGIPGMRIVPDATAPQGFLHVPAAAEPVREARPKPSFRLERLFQNMRANGVELARLSALYVEQDYDFFEELLKVSQDTRKLSKRIQSLADKALDEEATTGN